MSGHLKVWEFTDFILQIGYDGQHFFFLLLLLQKCSQYVFSSDGVWHFFTCRLEMFWILCIFCIFSYQDAPFFATFQRLCGLYQFRGHVFKKVVLIHFHEFFGENSLGNQAKNYIIWKREINFGKCSVGPELMTERARVQYCNWAILIRTSFKSIEELTQYM